MDMATVKSPLSPNVASHFSPYTDSPSSPAPFSKRTSGESNTFLHPNHPLHSPSLTSPSEADPSPIVSSNGTDFNDTDGENHEGQLSNRNSIKIQTTDENGVAHSAGAEADPESVIHAPEGFGSFIPHSESTIGRVTPTPSSRSEATIISPTEEDGNKVTSPAPPAISTKVPRSHDPYTTPHAQTIQEAEKMDRDKAARNSISKLEDIPELQDDDQVTESGLDTSRIRSPDQLYTLRTALQECWTLCNTLSGLSHIHRERAFRQSKKRDGREQAWKSCWQLCQKLYETWTSSTNSPVAPTLDLCRDFCQSLFEVRQIDNEVADSVLRVSFELNNHLYHTHDRALPDQFRERTLDFYITLCHRLMKQRNQRIEETDNLLRACWTLAEMLFNLRQNKREGNSANEELLASAVQACWELCDIFREGWTQVRPDRTTPRPSQPPFSQSFNHKAIASDKPVTISLDDDDRYNRLVAETPTSTIFEEDKMSPQSPGEDYVPNILVLGPDSGDRYDSDWSSSASSYSEFSKQSENTRQSEATGSSANTIRNAQEDPRLECLRLLAVKAAMNLGYKVGTPLVSYVKALATNSFGNTDANKLLLVHYKSLIAGDVTFRGPGSHQRASVADIARSVRWIAATGQQYAWLKDLFKWVLGVRVEEAGDRSNHFISS